SASTQTTILAAAALSIGKSASAGTVLAGQPLTYTVTVTNTGPSVATGVLISDTLPGGVSFASASNGCTPSGGTVTCGASTWPAGSTVSVTIVVTPGAPAVGLITNTASVQANEADLVPGNNTASVTTQVLAAAELAISKTASPTPVAVGQPLTYT